MTLPRWLTASTLLGARPRRRSENVATGEAVAKKRALILPESPNLWFSNSAFRACFPLPAFFSLSSVFP
jgi:hypothetical protein